ncbi:helix-turn-helix transcriptional regulator [Rhizobium gallicum]|uniref:helix-turn-helix transcriptional regulator n=1 Tax=Rhizobium gallicum TaxID=56730 RepID=UPI001EF96DED|nr:AraC family transcriptional regulator [Rhizobium gallicum]ULJ72284.1 AraC family transcriptional regulator [Rhizobium gallicum]
MFDCADVISRHSVDDDHLNAKHNVFQIIPESAGPRAPTLRGGVVYERRTGSGSHTYRPNSYVTAIYLAPSSGIEFALGTDELQTLNASAGTVTVSPADIDRRLIWSYPCETVTVSIPPSSLQELAQSEIPGSSLELRPGPSRQPDAHALYLARLMKAELSRKDAGNDLYLDSLITIFGIHLLRNYGVAIETPSRRGLSILAARRVQDYLGDNFSRKLSIAELAGVAKLSKSHFILAFTNTFGQPPHQYVVNLRLDCAERLLSNEDVSVAEVAYLSGFSSQSHLTSVMRKLRQNTPNQFRLLKRA